MLRYLIIVGKSSALIAIGVFFHQMINMLTVLFVGQMTDKYQLEGVGLAHMWRNIICDVRFT
jgi:hypothetical protein